MQAHTHTDKVQNMAVLVNNGPFAIFLCKINEAQSMHFVKYSDEIFSAKVEL